MLSDIETKDFIVVFINFIKSANMLSNFVLSAPKFETSDKDSVRKSKFNQYLG